MTRDSSELKGEEPEDDIHLRMLEVAAKHDFRFGAVQMPRSVTDAHLRSLEKEVLLVLVRAQIAVQGTKSIGSGSILKRTTVSTIECLYYALNLPTSVVITGIDSMERLDQAIEAAKTFRPLTQGRPRRC